MSRRWPWILAGAGTLLVLGGLLSPTRDETERARETRLPPAGGPSTAAGGPCDTCHDPESSLPVRRFTTTPHAVAAVVCMDCHRALEGQQARAHHGFTLVARVTAGSCRRCHAAEYAQLARSPHGPSAWESILPGDGSSAGPDAGTPDACTACHDIGRPNDDGSTGRCVACHRPHRETAEAARADATCTACHADQDGHPREGASVTCARCHFGAVAGVPATHDVGERAGPRQAIRAVCLECHLRGRVEAIFESGAQDAAAVADLLRRVAGHVADRREAGELTPAPLDEPLEWAEFDLWHRLGPAARHAAFTAPAGRARWEPRQELERSAAGLTEPR